MGIFLRISILLSLSFAGTLTEALAAQGRKTEQARPWLGVSIAAGKEGVLVKSVIEGTPAAEARLEAGDEILSVGKTKVAKPDELIATVRSQGVGNTVTVAFKRKGKLFKKEMKLVARPDDLELVRKQVEGRPVPTGKLEVVSGEGGDNLGAYKGKTVLVEFWATWCPACRATHERLSAFAKEAKRRGIAVVGISNETKAEIQAYVDQVKPSFIVLRDQDDLMHKELMISAIPMLLVIDKAGVMRYATIGAGSYLEQAIVETEKLAKSH